ncbi:MAG: FG-GAP-like repeat-containing protein, partial [Planctomycetota bacterium]|nr:FG-GAP-like repeat-containing protein [Planctomycetota bacterium]
MKKLYHPCLIFLSLILMGCSPVIIGAVVVASSAGGGGGGGGGGGAPEDLRPRATINNAVVNETDGIVTLTVTLSEGFDQGLQINFSTANGTAQAGVDFVANAGTLNFESQSRTRTLDILLINNSLFESNRQFTVNISTQFQGIQIPSASATITLVEDELDPATASQLTLLDNIANGIADQPLNPIRVAITDDSSNLVAAAQNQIFARFKQASGQFFDRTRFLNNEPVDDLATGDIDGDGKADIVTVSLDSSRFTVYLNSTNPGEAVSFVEVPQLVQSATSLFAVELADLNGDELLDIVVGSGSREGVFVHFQDPSGDGVFLDGIQLVPTLNEGQLSLEIITGDLNGDGLIDVFFANERTNSFLQDPNAPGSFIESDALGVALRFARPVPGDFNGDSLLDLAFIESDGGVRFMVQDANAGSMVDFFSNRNTFGFGADFFNRTLADINGDGLLDIIGVGVRESMGGRFLMSRLQNPNIQGRFDDPVFLPVDIPQPKRMTVLDVNLDGRPDLLTSSRESGGLTVFLNDPNSPSLFRLSPGIPGFTEASIAAADFNSDEISDIVIANNASAPEDFSVILGDPVASYGLRSGHSIDINDEVKTFAVGDLNGDARPDALFVNDRGLSESFLTVQLNLGTTPANFEMAPPLAAGTKPIEVKIADMNNDGRNDVIVCEQTLGLVRIFFQAANAPGTFPNNQVFVVGATPQGIAVGDLNNDGRTDFATFNNSNTITISLQNAQLPGQFATQSIALAAVPRSLEINDFNQDNVMDFVIGDRDANNILFYFQSLNTPGTFPIVATLANGFRAEKISVGDFDNDGIRDIAASNALNLRMLVQSPSIPGQFEARSTLVFPDGLRSFAVADINGDLRDDIVISARVNIDGNFTEALFTALQSPTTPGLFPAFVRFGQGFFSSELAIADFDNDGRPEVMSLNADILGAII